MTTPADGRGDFDFLLGTWRVANRRRPRPLDAGEGGWEEFSTDAVVRPVLDGLGNTDTFRSRRGPDGAPFEGLTLRLFDPVDGLWRIWWASTRRPGHLDPPMTGSFTAGHGVFLGDDRVDGVPVRVRFDWYARDDGTARWEQAFSLDGGSVWTTNWTMDFARSGDLPRDRIQARVRPARREDAAQMARVNVRCWQETYRGLVSDAVLDDPGFLAARERFWTAVLTDERYRENRVAVAERDDEVVGIAMSGLPRDAAAAPVRQLYVLYVYAAHHGTGAGQALLEAVVHPGEPAALWVADPNPRAQAFYRKHGFVADGTAQVEDGVREIRMVRGRRHAR